MNSRPPILGIAAAGFLTLLILCAIWGWFNRAEARLLADDQERQDNQRQAWSQQEAGRAAAARQQALDVEAAHHEELVRALGGPGAAATKDPTLDIRQMLRQLARACAPPGADVSVTVDGFTDFDVAFALRDTLPISQVAAVAQPLLDAGTPYLHSLRFIQGNDVLAQLDWSAIASVSNWSAAPAETIERLLLASGAPPQRSGAPAASDFITPPEDLNADQRKDRDAQFAFLRLYNKHTQALNQMVNDLNRSTRLAGFQNRSQIQQQIEWLDELGPSVSAEREFFLNQPEELERALGEQSLDALRISIYKRDRTARLMTEGPLIANVFDAVSAYRGGIRDFLANMAASWGDWQPDPASQRIRFTTIAAKETYTAGAGNARQRAEEVTQAMRAWNAFAQSQSLKAGQ